MKKWCIVNLKWLDITSWVEKLDKKYAPTSFYDEKETAEKELLRLATLYPGNVFTLFESVSTAIEIKTYDNKIAVKIEETQHE